MSMIEVNDLVKWHGSIEVLKGVNLSVRRGEVATIIGPSGSGKSTFLRCLNGLETFQGGLSRSTACDLAPTMEPPSEPGSSARFACGSAWSSRASTCFRIEPCCRT